MMKEGDSGPRALRELKLEDVAAYLKCDPERLRILLSRLAIAPSAIDYGSGAAAITKAISATPAELDYMFNSGDEITELEALSSKQDDRTCMKGRKCGTHPPRRTHDRPKRGKTMWYAWYFYCPVCGWMF